MKRFSLTRLAALSLTLMLMAPPSGLAQERDDFSDDFLPDTPLQPLDHIVTDPDPEGWVSDVFGDPGELPPLDPVPDAPPPAATPDSQTPEIATPVAEAGFDLPEGWAWHEIVISQPREEISYPVRIGFPGDFFKIDAEAMPDFTGEEGSVSFTETDLVQMGEAVMAGESDPYGTLVTLGLSRRPELPQIARDRGFSETSRGTLTLASGIVMTRLSGRVKEGDHTMVLEVFESQVPIDGTVYLTLMIVAYGEREIDSLAEGVAQSLSITPSPVAPAEDDGPAEPLVLLDGALIIAELPEDWKLFNQRDGVVTFRSIGGYQGFIAIETGSRAVTAADLSQTFTGTPTERRGEIMGLPARLFEGRQAHDAFLQGYNMVAGSRVLALPDACLPDGVPVAITWAGSPGWFEQGAFDRFFEVARLDGLVPCPPPPVAPSASPPAAEIIAPQTDVPPAEPEHVAIPQPETPPTVAQGDTNAATLQAEILFWESVRDMDTQAAYEVYLSRWPEGQFAAIARLRLTGLSQPKSAETTHEAPPSNATAAAVDCERLTGTTITDAFAAITACREALARQPDAADLHHYLGRALQAYGADAEALSHLRQAADGGVPAAMTELALVYRQGLGVAPDDTLALRWYRAAAEAGDAQAMNNLGFMLDQGLGGSRPDPAEAAYWYLRAAEAGSLFGMKNIGRFYLEGRGVAQDHAQALYWLRRGAEAGHYPAMNDLGIMYAMGQAGPVDHRQAVAWYRRAADAGNPSAMANLALAYSNGWGVTVNPEQAARWFEQSIRGGAGVSVLGVLGGLPRPVVRALQLRLIAAGVYAGSADGMVGTQTRNAVSALDGMGG